MATDHDAPRTREGAVAEYVGGPLSSRPQSASRDLDDGDMVESFELPGADLSGQELSTTVVRPQHGEFVCVGCFLVQHRSQVGRVDDEGAALCAECTV